MGSLVPSDGPHVLIIGAGTTGLLIAQKLKMLDIKCTVFERDLELNQRPRDWNFGVFWAQCPLLECLPKSINLKIRNAYTDPHRIERYDDCLPIYDGKTGELFMQIPTPNVLRFRKCSLQAMLSEGIDVQYNKQVWGIHVENSAESVTALFDDGSKATGQILVGADGAKSKVREYLLGPDQAKLQALPLLGCGIVHTFPAHIARSIREKYNEISTVFCHPDGLCVFLSIHSVPDQDKPETWEWMVNMTWYDEGEEAITDIEAIRSVFDSWCKKLLEPLRSALLSLPGTAKLYCSRLHQWPTIPWDNRKGTVTLAGDAAHPMTYHRGQGLNNAVHDAANFCRALYEYTCGVDFREEKISAYEKELVERGRKAVTSSGQNSLMLHDMEKMKMAPLFISGVSRDENR